MCQERVMAGREEERHGSPRVEDARVERAVLDLLLCSSGPGLWSFEELVREIGDEVVVQDALAHLNAAGLIHRLEKFVFATRAATRLDETFQ
jgi:hypothetical protein